MYDFAISFFGPDRAWADWIAAVLAGRGGRVLLLEAGRPGGSPGSDAVWVPLVSGSSEQQREAWPDWWWWDGPDGQADPQARPVVTDTVNQPDGAQWLGLMALSREHDQAHVASALCEYLGLASVRGDDRAAALSVSMPLYPPLRPAVWNIPGRNVHFTGRQEELAQARESLVADPGVPCVISGPAGVGKTSLAIEYAYQYRAHYQGCWWADGELDPNAPQYGLLDPADARPWLQILDDADGAAPAPGTAARGACHVLITSEHPADGRANQELTPLSTTDAIKLAARLGIDVPGLAREVARLAGGFPIAVWVAAYLLRTGADPARRADELRRQLAAGMPGGGSVAEPAARLAMAAIPPASADLLQVMAALATRPLPVAAVRAGVLALPDPLAAAVRAQPDLGEVAGSLAEAGLLRRDGERLVLHTSARRMAAAVVHDRPQRSGHAAGMILSAAYAYRHRTPGDRDWAELLPHLIVVADMATGLPAAFPAATIADYLRYQRAGHVNPADVVAALRLAADHFAASGEYTTSRDLAARAARFAERLPGEPVADRITRLVNLASHERAAGHAREALPLLQEARRLAQADRPAEYADLLLDQPGLLSELARTYAAVGEHAEAVKLAGRLDLLSQQGAFGAGFDGADARQLHAMTLFGVGRLAEARALLEECLDMASASPDWKVGSIEKDLARVLLSLKEPGRALDALAHCVPRLESWFGAGHPVTAEALALKAQAISMTAGAGDGDSAFAEAIAAADGSGVPGLACGALLRQSEALLAAGRIAESMASCREAIQKADDSFLPAVQRAGVRRAAAETFLKIGAADNAAVIIGEALELLAGPAEQGRELRFRLLNLHATAGLAGGNYPAAVNRAERARSAISRSAGIGAQIILDNLNILGQALVQVGRAAEAVPHLAAACELAERNDGVPRDELPHQQAALALAWRTAGDAEAALGLCDDAITRLESATPADAEWAGQILGLLRQERGAALLELDRPDEAAASFRAAVQAVEKAISPPQAPLARLLSNIGQRLLKSGHPEQASSYLRHAAQLWRDLMGADSLEATDCLDSLGQAWSAMGLPHQAISLHAQAASGLERSRPGHPHIAVSLYNLGVACIADREPDQAVAALERAVEIDARAYGEQHPEVAADLEALAHAHDLAGRPEDARQCRARAAGIRGQ